MDRILRLSADGLAALGQSNAQPTDGPVPDSAEQVYISSLALLKMLKHGRAGVPMEVMGLMLGEFVDDYTVTVVDVFAMPQSGTGVSVEAVDPVFQAKMLDMLKQTGRPEMVVGWYHSHPGFGCWLSGVDMNTQQSFEALSDRAVAVVVDPIQSVKGKVVIDAFRLINPNLVIANQEPRQTTSNVGHLNKPSLQALIHGLNRQYYSLPINYRKNQWETKMLMDLNKNTWKDGLALADYDAHCSNNHKTLTAMLDLVKAYHKSLEEEEKMTPEQLLVKNVGRMTSVIQQPLVARVNEYNIKGPTEVATIMHASRSQSLALARSGRVLLADDMGLGKTIQALAVAAAYRSDWPLLVVAPSSVRFSWRDQCMRWLSGPLRITSADILVVANGRDMEGINQYTTKLITIISYDLMAKHAEQLRLCNFGVIIMDESHFLKNSKTSRTKAAIPLLKATVSRPAELYSQISGVAPNLFPGGFHEFGLRYCAAKECPWGWDYTGCSHMTELQLILEESIMIRRLKSDVLSQLPPKRRELVVLDPNVIKAGRLKSHAKRMVTSSLPSDERRAAMLQYFHETASVKVPALQQYVLDLVEVGRKFLVYAHHTEVLDALSNLLMEKSIDFIRIDGRTNSEQRSVVCRKFQEEENCLVALLSITAAGTGLNMTAASLVVFAELYWNPGALVQAEDRAYRIGQQDSVSVRSLIEKKLNVLSKAGLNQETFRTADTTRLGTTVQQSILDFFESELMTDDDEEVDRLLMNIHDPNVADSSPVFEEEQNTKRTSPPAKRTKLTNLFAQAVTQPAAAPDVLNCSGRVLVSDTPETSPDKSSGQTADKDFVATPVALGPSSTSTDLEKTVTLEEDDTVLLEAAIAAEVAWLTEGLLTETDENQFG
ncbi:helicase protein, partial [Opisthorchis viverrini]